MPMLLKLSNTYLSLQIIVLFFQIIKVLQIRSNGKNLTVIHILTLNIVYKYKIINKI